jgi:glycerol uptake facilitator-like aquaporin
MTHTLPRKIVAEFAGTGFLVAAVVGSGIIWPPATSQWRS